jgi:LysM repeat protein
MVAIQVPRDTVERPSGHGEPALSPSGTGGPDAGRARAVAPRLRLPDRATRVRRRRLAVLVLALVVLGSVLLGVQAISGLAEVGGSSGPRPVEVGPVAGQQYVVQPGDTLWSIAQRIAPDDDPRAVVDALRAANGGPGLEVGDRIMVDLD